MKQITSQEQRKLKAELVKQLANDIESYVSMQIQNGNGMGIYHGKPKMYPIRNSLCYFTEVPGSYDCKECDSTYLVKEYDFLKGVMQYSLSYHATIEGTRSLLKDLQWEFVRRGILLDLYEDTSSTQVCFTYRKRILTEQQNEKLHNLLVTLISEAIKTQFQKDTEGIFLVNHRRYLIQDPLYQYGSLITEDRNSDGTYRIEKTNNTYTYSFYYEAPFQSFPTQGGNMYRDRNGILRMEKGRMNYSLTNETKELLQQVVEHLEDDGIFATVYICDKESSHPYSLTKNDDEDIARKIQKMIQPNKNMIYIHYCSNTRESSK